MREKTAKDPGYDLSAEDIRTTLEEQEEERKARTAEAAGKIEELPGAAH